MQASSYRFDRYELEPGRRVLRADGKDIAVTPRAFDLLLVLVERAGQLVSKNDLLELVWPKLVVEENNLQVQISALRKLLGPQAIATVPGRGYKFTLLPDGAAVSPVKEAVREPSAPTIAIRAPGNLPAQLPALYGRDEELATLARLLGQHRVVSVVGPGGIGKTRVAQAVACELRSRYPGGGWLVEFAPLTDPSLVVPTVARVLGLPLGTSEGAAAALVQLIRDQQLLLVLDNCEHLLAAVAQLVVRIVGGAPRVRLLITSQEPLHVAGEQVNRLDALALPAAPDAADALSYGAVELFVARASAADPRFVLSAGNVGDVVEICRRLDGIALAIELAAARVPLLGANGLRRRLDERLRLLAGGDRTALPRHQTLRAALQWSYGLLSAAEQVVFDRLGAFVGSFSLEAAQQVASDEQIDKWTVLDCLATLVDKSLVLVEEGDTPRYRLLESSRAFALERLAAAGALEAMRQRHAQAIADTLMNNDPFEEPNARMRRVAPDLDNVRAAAGWATGPSGDRKIAIAVAAAADMLWDAQGCNDEGHRLHLKVEPWLDESVPPKLAARFWFAASNVRLNTELERQAQAATKAVDSFRRLGDRAWLCRALHSAALKFSWLRDPVAAEKSLDEMEQLLEPAWPAWLRAAIEYFRGHCKFFAEDAPEEARAHLDAAMELHRRVGGSGYFALQCELVLMLVDLAVGKFDAALRRSRDLLARSESSIGTSRTWAMILAVHGAALTRLGHLDEAEASLRTAVPVLTHALGPGNWSLLYTAYLLACQGRLVEAVTTIGYVDSFRSARVASMFARGCHDQALAIARTALDAEELDRLRAYGAKLTEGGALALAFPPPT